MYFNWLSFAGFPGGVRCPSCPNFFFPMGEDSRVAVRMPGRSSRSGLVPPFNIEFLTGDDGRAYLESIVEGDLATLAKSQPGTEAIRVTTMVGYQVGTYTNSVIVSIEKKCKQTKFGKISEEFVAEVYIFIERGGDYKFLSTAGLNRRNLKRQENLGVLDKIDTWTALASIVQSAAKYRTCSGTTTKHLQWAIDHNMLEACGLESSRKPGCEEASLRSYKCTGLLADSVTSDTTNKSSEKSQFVNLTCTHCQEGRRSLQTKRVRFLNSKEKVDWEGGHYLEL